MCGSEVIGSEVMGLEVTGAGLTSAAKQREIPRARPRAPETYTASAGTKQLMIMLPR
jgi:hypothetical protein